MADAVHVEFRFAIGDEVTLKAMCSPFLAEHSASVRKTASESLPLPQKMVVVGRVMEECVGWAQVHYKVRVYSTVERGWRGEVVVGRDLFTFGEFELMPWTEVLAARGPQKGAGDV